MSPRGELRLHYSVTCDPAALIIPAYVKNGGRTDGLWHTTCFELFARRSGEPGYLEFNFSPSSQWAAYRFSGYREGMRDWSIAAPQIFTETRDDGISMQVTLALTELAKAPLDLGLSAVVHETGDVKSYWAVAHPPEKPDFHHPDCFALHLPASAQP